MLYFSKLNFVELWREISMAALAVLSMYAIIIGVISLVAYFVIKKAIKDALREIDEEKMIR